MFNFVLTLPGIAGIILTIGMAIDANVLIYERLREELALGKSLKTAVQAAFEKAFSSIFDSNVTTLITAIILFWQASGPVKGFAISLTMGILASMFTVLIVCRNAFSWVVDTGRLKKMSMLQLIPGAQHQFSRQRQAGGPLFARAGHRGSHGFRDAGESGTLASISKAAICSGLSSTQPVSVAQVREALQPLGFDDAAIQQSKEGGKNYITVRTPINTSDAVQKQLVQALPDAGFKVEQSERVGALVGGELAKRSLWALALGMIGILIYVTFRFELSFAVGSIVALLHDVLITVGIFSLMGRELTLTMVGALLTIAGYSINDTIVVYDRIREGLASSKRGSIEQIMNLSINETLSRTVLTGGVTFVSVLCLFFFGGAVLRDFALVIIIGILVGTYSSIFIAAPIVLWWTRARGGSAASLRREVADKAAATKSPATS